MQKSEHYVTIAGKVPKRSSLINVIYFIFNLLYTESRNNMKKLLLIIDMVNGFTKEGALADRNINHINENIIALIKNFKENGHDIISIQEGHTENSKEFENFPKHCILGTEEAELIDELKPYEKDMKLIRKNSTSGFVTEEFQKYLKSNEKNLEEIIITGCCTDICIINFALPLKNYINEHNLNISVIVPKNAVETYNTPNHSREEYNEMAFKLMEQSGIKIVC